MLRLMEVLNMHVSYYMYLYTFDLIGLFLCLTLMIFSTTLEITFKPPVRLDNVYVYVPPVPLDQVGFFPFF